MSHALRPLVLGFSLALLTAPASFAAKKASAPAKAASSANAVASAAAATPAQPPLGNAQFMLNQFNEILLPAQNALATAAAGLPDATRRFCAASAADKPAAFSALQAQYVATLLAWRAIEVAPIGPSADPEVGQLMEGASRAPAEILTLTKLQPAAQMVDGQAAYEAKKLPAWGMGFKAIESLLYTDTPQQSIARLSAAPACQYLLWQSQVVSYQGETLRRAWVGLSRGVQYDLSYPRTYQTQYLNRLIEGARELASQKVGFNANGWLDAASGQTVASLQANVGALARLLRGNPVGLEEFVTSRNDAELWRKVEAPLSRLELAASQLSASPSRDEAKTLADAANALAEVLQHEVAPKMSIQIGKKAQ
ncbi:imelysin family protein [Chitinibacter sp. ZOR0017]|uniref:imelysin family protein n=1 Tax=Chitinibacter sp. ZOR0017 TaxID=1339254 RepID=UPI0006463C1C|nr:hypothetical protein [Chitinibacter sp. ZOR0017]